ncbi:hypothetical protein PT277_00680 [Acetobacteraceae bacterium ESL0709]|nr:hypothetical protein [Acetobacteraceae bacterium ESL0697]MDF7677228.1 hypothetical protein [Acetobacteraceae bacterium ESL0709]
MPAEILPALRLMVEHWVVKKAPSVPPEKLTSEDLNHLARAAIETLSQRALGIASSAWGPLETVTRGWIVQRQKGEAPAPMGEDDFRRLVRFVLEGFSNQPVTTEDGPKSAADLAAFGAKSEETLPDGRRVADLLAKDPFFFAREHLAQSL